MRLERLQVDGFGRLHDVEIDFAPRITVLLGENESGKSTVHRALRAALFGIDAGGQGRPTERSDWARWTPWSGGTYSLVLTYELASGRRYRVARRLERREQGCQVQEIGGPDVTNEVRRGRAVVPGAAHLGIDEAVFCASACVGEDGLRLGAADAPAARAPAVQEAIERLADSGEETTAAEALGRIADAVARVGSERRAGSPLGQAVNRLRQLDVQVDEARRRLRLLAADEERLRALEREAAAADERRRDAERRWLLGRLAGIEAQQAELEACRAERSELAQEIAATAGAAAFPIEAEDHVATLAAASLESRRGADEAMARARGAAPRLAEVRRRRSEIGAGLRVLSGAVPLDEETVATAADLERRLAAATAGERVTAELAAATRRRDALRRELAATGIAGTAAAVEGAIELLGAVRPGARGRFASGAAPALILAAAGVAAVLVAAHRGVLAVAALAAGAVAAIAALGLARVLGGEAEQARRRLARLCPGVALDPEGLRRLAERLPRVRALNTELQREEIRVETLSGEVEAADAAVRALAEEAIALAGRCGLRGPAAGPRSARETVRAVLDAVGSAAGMERRRAELIAEDAALAEREADLEAYEAEGAAAARAATDCADRLRHVLAAARLDPALETAAALAAFRAGCDARRRHEAAVRRAAELDRRALAADPAALARLRAELEDRLRDRGGDPTDAAASEPLDQGRLQDLELAVEHARQGAHAASTAAAALRSGIEAVRAGLASLADLEDERSACVAARDRALGQLAALQRAASLITAATRDVHHDLAPRLAGSVGDRLALITDGRYTAVNVDTAHFAVALLGPDRPDLVPLELVSHGTRDQVSLLLRLALAEVLSDAGEPVPVLLDEPLLSADPSRRAAALRFLWNLSSRNQVVVSLSEPSIAVELVDLCGSDDVRVVTMPAGEAPLALPGRPVVVARSL